MTTTTFKQIPTGSAFDFEESGWLGCIKTSPKKYLYKHGTEYWEVQVGTTQVAVSNPRPLTAQERAVLATRSD